MSNEKFGGTNGKKRSTPLEYGFALLLVALATGLRMMLEPAMGLSVPYVTFLLSNALVIRFTGPIPSVLTILLSTAVADWFFLPPRFTLWSSPAQYFTSVLFMTANLVVMALAHAMRTAKEQAESHARNLEKTVEERTARLQEVVGDLEHFSYTLSHDLRAPLRTIEGFSHLMLQGGCASCCNDSSTDLLHRINAGTGRMNALISDALEYSKAVRSELKLGPVDIRTLVRSVLEDHPSLHHEIADISIDGGFPPVLGNETALAQCFANLLTNAVKFVSQGVRPSVRICSEGRPHGWVRLWVEDNGIGIRKEDQAKLFRMFQRMTRDYEGTGIGLALVRKNVERMGGKVGVESEPGTGSRFWMDLKRASVPV